MPKCMELFVFATKLFLISVGVGAGVRFSNAQQQQQQRSEVQVDLVELNLCCDTQFSYVDGKCETNSVEVERRIFSDEDKQRIVQAFRDWSKLSANASAAADAVHGISFSFNDKVEGEASKSKCGDTTTSLTINLPLTENGNGIQEGTTSSDTDTDKANNNNYNGEIRATGHVKHNNFFYAPTEYCINGYNQHGKELRLELVVCPKSCPESSSNGRADTVASKENVSCLRKCCAIDELLESTNNKFNCVPVSNHSQIWNPKLHQSQLPHVEVPAEDRNRTVHLVHSNPKLEGSSWCESGDGFFMYQRDLPDNPKVPFHILQDGRVHYQSYGDDTWMHLEEGSYCIDGIFESDRQEGEPLPEDNNVIYYCPPQPSDAVDTGHSEDEEEDYNSKIYIFYYVILIISSVFLLLTIIIHSCLLQNQNIHGWTLLCFFVSLFCLYIFLALFQWSRIFYQVKGPNNPICRGIGISLHFFYLSTFAWLSIVNFDVWFTFRTLRNLVSQSNKWRRFFMYAVFAIGGPVVILVIALILDAEMIKARKNASPEGSPVVVSFIAPGYAQKGCFISTREAILAYLYGPIGVLLVFNVILFVLTVLSMYKLKKTSSMAANNSNSSQHPQKSFHLFLKLFVLMGVCWIFEVISWALHPETIPWYFIIFDIINIAQGFFIFIIFACKRSTMQLLEEKSPCLKELRRSVRGLMGSIPCLRDCLNLKLFNRSISNDSDRPQEMSERKLSDTEVSNVSTAC